MYDYYDDDLMVSGLAPLAALSPAGRGGGLVQRGTNLARQTAGLAREGAQRVANFPGFVASYVPALARRGVQRGAGVVQRLLPRRFPKPPISIPVDPLQGASPAVAPNIAFLPSLPQATLAPTNIASPGSFLLSPSLAARLNPSLTSRSSGSSLGLSPSLLSGLNRVPLPSF